MISRLLETRIGELERGDVEDAASEVRMLGAEGVEEGGHAEDAGLGALAVVKD